MQEVTFDLQTITPLFMAGADQATAELRAPSFRGEMRYWQRALVGSVVGTTGEGIKQVADCEKDIFGATDKSSLIQARIHARPQTTRLEREGRTRATATGRDYLLWSALQGQRPAIPPQTTFQITLTSRHPDKELELPALEKGVGAFWLLTHLGGVGTRSRRCAGSLSITRTKGETFGFPFHIPTSAEELQKQLSEGISRSKSLYESREVTVRQKPSFDILRSDACLIWILLNNGKPWQDANQAMRDIGSKLRQYREEMPMNERKIFGIPVMVMTNSRSHPYTIQGAGKHYKRVASPIHLRLSKLQIGNQKQYVGVATLFKTKWDDMSEKDYEQYALIEKWIQQEFAAAPRVIL
ncbi:MAG: type III-B CRISPR module RAMP protein Cmr1 [Ktedonobacteraceae bacterium]|nr:type III-B CRISPR module RAMP protein Cmr1 [Ktedonobacteraceae bacterium]